MNKLSQLETNLGKLVKIRSISGEKETAYTVIDFVKKQLVGLPLYFKEFDDGGYPILLATSRDTLSPETLLVAHADVLPAPESLFNMHADKEKLYGRGVWDMKFAIAGYIEVIKSLGAELTNYDVGLLITSDEETRNKNVDYILNRGIRSSNVVLLDGSADWRVEALAKGAWTVKLTASGVSVHGSRPWEGENAINTLLDALSQVRSWFPKQSPEDDTLNISILKAGQAQNQLPKRATAFLDMRFTSLKNQQAIRDKIINLTKDSQLEWETVTDLEPLVHDLKNHYISTFAKCAYDVARAPVTGLMSYGSSEAVHFINVGIPCIVTRPKGGGHHSENEWVDRQSLDKLVPILVEYLDRLQTK